MWPHDYFTLLQNKVTNCRLPIRRLGPPTSQFLQTDAVYILIGFPHFKGLDLDYPRSLSRFQLVKTEGEKKMMGGTGLRSFWKYRSLINTFRKNKPSPLQLHTRNSGSSPQKHPIEGKQISNHSSHKISQRGIQGKKVHAEH